MEKFSHLIKNNPLFRNIPSDSLDTVIQCLNGTHKTYPHRSPLFYPGQKIPRLGIVLKGAVETFLPYSDGSWMLINQAQPGDLFAHALTVSGITDHSFEIYACENSEILFLTVPEFTALKNSNCAYRFKVMENLMVLIAKRNTELLMKMQILAQNSLRQKLLLYFAILSKQQNSSTITIPFGRDKLASYLSCDRSAVSRELGRMQKEGMIEVSRNTITLLSELAD